MIQSNSTRLLDSVFKKRADLNRAYMMSLKSHNLLQNHYYEAGLWTPWGQPQDCHGGWEYPTSAVKGQFLGHWMSGAARLVRYENDIEAGAKLSFIIDELEKCQKANGGEWVHSCPEKYLHWALCGRLVGVPHYTIHKTMMGLWDSFHHAGSQKALDILLAFTNYFINFTKSLTTEQMDDLLDFETGGMMEIFANIYNLTKRPEHKELMEKYERRRLLDPLIQGRDVLTNMHANTTVPEILGAAKAYEVTGNERYIKAVRGYWDCAVSKRGYYATGSANSGEIWCPPGDFASRLGGATQEHCTQYNMIRLAEFLFRHTTDAVYADYIERSLYNAVLAQQNPDTGMVIYYLPLEPGAKKHWGTPTQTFWCCHGSLVQVHTLYAELACYTGDGGIIISQFIPFEAQTEYGAITLEHDTQGGESQALKTYSAGPVQKPDSMVYHITVDCAGAEFEIKIRKPWWVKGACCSIDGQTVCREDVNGFFVLRRVWNKQKITVTFEKEIKCVPMPGDGSLCAFMDGPVVLAGLCDRETALNGSFRPIDAKRWMAWNDWYIRDGIRFMPLHEVTDQTYTVYFKAKG